MKNLIRIVGLSLLLAKGAAAQSNFAGIYLCDLSAADPDIDYYGSVAVIVRTNNQATLVGAASSLTNSAIGLYAQFKVQNDGTWNYQTNGFTAHGHVYTNGSFTGELDSSGGRVSTIDNGALQPDSGPFQGRAGYYAGTWNLGANSGKLFGILTAFGELTYCVVNAANQPIDGGGPDQLDELNNNFDSFTVVGAEASGTITNATFTIGGSYISTSLAVGHFRMTRAAFVPRHLPPVITSLPQDKTVTYGANATFSVTATGDAPLYYQWYSNDVALAGATARTLTIPNVGLPFDGTIYKVVIQNAIGQTNAEAVLTAVPESVPPTLSITAPTAGQRVSNAVVQVTGHATDNVRLDSVWYQLNSGAWTQATGASNWYANVGLKAGTNVVAAYSMDASGNLSPTRRVSFVFVVPSTITLVTNGVGTITHGFTGNVLEVGRTYTVTAVPGAGQVFSNWVGSGSINSSSAVFSFLMKSNMVLQGNFIPNPFLPAKGLYTGLFAQATRSQDRSGFFTLTLGDHGAYTAALKRGTNSYGLSGQFSVAGTASQTVVAGGSTWTVTMALDLAGAKTLTGTVGPTAWKADLLAYRAVFDSVNNPATQFKGRYTLILPGNDNASASPGGDGYGTVVVGAGGYVTLNGTLGDNFAWSQNVPLSSTGDWACYVPLYGGIGSVWGWLQFDTNHPSAKVDGTLSWIRPARPGSTYYAAGFTNLVAAGGSRYTAPTNANTRVINLTNGVVFFEGGNLSAPFTNVVTLTSSNRVINSSANSLGLSIAVTDGTFSGSVKVPGTTRTNTFKGALLQDLNSGYGYFLGTNQSGRVFFGKP